MSQQPPSHPRHVAMMGTLTAIFLTYPFGYFCADEYISICTKSSRLQFQEMDTANEIALPQRQICINF